MVLRCIAYLWQYAVDLGVTFWVLRAIVAAMPLAFVILGVAPQAQDLLLDVSLGPWWYITFFLLAVFFVWAVPTHYAARLLLNTDRRYLLRIRRRKSIPLEIARKWTPRVLGLLPFVAMLMAVMRASENVPSVEPPNITQDVKYSLLLLAVYLTLSALAFWLYLVGRKGVWRRPLIARLSATLNSRFVPIAAGLPRALQLGRHAPGLSQQTGELGSLYLLATFFALTFAPFFAPVLFAEWFPRALAVPFVFAGWTPLAAYASGVGRHLRVPIILYTLIIGALLTYLLGDNYAVRLVNTDQHAAAVMKRESHLGTSTADPKRHAQDTGAERPKLTEAITLWKRANLCLNDSAICPRPIIVAASGGASRAGFFTASVIGKLMDGVDGIAPGEMRNRLFAISSVSGSSVGAVMVAGALAASDGRQPCKDREFWLRFEPNVRDWQSCFEAMMTGDFLTPVFAGLVFRDTLRFLGVFGEPGSLFGWSDRATLIEQSWERHFKSSLRGRTTFPPYCSGSLDCPFLTLRPHEVEGGIKWLPLLMLNGVSVSTGQRIITTTLAPWYQSGMCPQPLIDGQQERCPIFDKAYDFHWLISSGATRYWRPLSSKDDLRISTAAHNSARFPFISPPGEVRDRGNNVIDQIVDGGYFDNFGALTAAELAIAIRAVDPGLAPFVLMISNDPEIPIANLLKAPEGEGGAFLTDLRVATTAMLNARAARGNRVLEDVLVRLAEDIPKECAPFAAHIRVWPEYVRLDNLGNVRFIPLSFSWWLSKPVQLRLHQQVDAAADDFSNKEAFGAVSAALGPKLAGCAAKGQTVRKYEGVRPLPQRQRP